MTDVTIAFAPLQAGVLLRVLCDERAREAAIDHYGDAELRSAIDQLRRQLLTLAVAPVPFSVLVQIGEGEAGPSP